MITQLRALDGRYPWAKWVVAGAALGLYGLARRRSGKVVGVTPATGSGADGVPISGGVGFAALGGETVKDAVSGVTEAQTGYTAHALSLQRRSIGDIMTTIQRAIARQQVTVSETMAESTAVARSARAGGIPTVAYLRMTDDIGSTALESARVGPAMAVPVYTRPMSFAAAVAAPIAARVRDTPVYQVVKPYLPYVEPAPVLAPGGGGSRYDTRE